MPRENVRWFSPRLLSRLKEAASSNTVIISALAGFGKTTAGEYIWKELLPKRAPKFWHSCLDGSALSEWKRFCETVRKIDALAGDGLLSLGPPDRRTSGDAASMLSDISRAEETWLFIDDFHKFVHSGIDVAAWGGFWRREAENLHVVVMTRHFGDETPRGCPGVAWLDYGDLALEPAGIRAFFDLHGVKLKEREEFTVHKYTLGNVMGAWLEINEYIETGKFRRLDDEVSYHDIMRQPCYVSLTDEQRDFMLHVSPF
ncbi:MAG: hypothetical protein LBL51_02410, partial [Synergistaceae bacterium]|nr:hypothetical protein [Synergistaceae bacterium]